MDGAAMIDTRVITTADGLDDIAAAWHQLAEKSARTPFQTFAWMKAWWSLVGDYDSTVRPHIVVVSDANGICAIAPFMVRDEERGPVLRFATDPWTDYHDILVDPAAADGDAALAALGDHVLAGLGVTWTAVVLEEIPPWSEFALPDSRGTRTGESSTAYRLLLRDTATAEAVRRGRYEHAVKRRRLGRLGEVRFALHAEPGSISARMPAFMAMHLRQWMGRPEPAITFDDPSLVRCYFGMVERLGHAGLLTLAELSLDGRPLAFHLGFSYRGTFWAYRAAFDLDMRRYSPGHLLNQSLVETLAAAGFHTVDFMRGDHAYKREYTNQCVVNRCILATAEE
jgi:CelD/BcsL family acetyltransferase involved in cellulose biosynthesis